MSIGYYLIISAVLFVMGVAVVLLRRNAIIIFMGLELMYNAANLAFVAFASMYKALEGQLFVFFVMTVAAAEVAGGLALMVAIFRSKRSIDVDQLNNMKG
jgi:NADH-quinone oxidoreductase subunit K